MTTARGMRGFDQRAKIVAKEVKQIPGFGTTEGDILRAIRDFLRIHGFFVTRNQQGLGNEKGKPDLEAVSPQGEHWWLEIKKPGGKLDEHQVKFRDRLLECRANFRIATCIEDVEDLCARKEHA